MFYYAFCICLILGFIRGLQELHIPSHPVQSSKNLWDFLFPN
jgi:hypothetical protein